MVAKGEPVPQVPGAGTPRQRREHLGTQHVEQRGLDQRRVGRAEPAFAEHQRAEPLDAASDQFGTRPAHLVGGCQQRRADLPGGRLVHGRGQPDPGVGLTRRPVGHRDRQPGRTG